MDNVIDFPIGEASTHFTSIKDYEKDGLGRRIALCEGLHKDTGLRSYAVLMQATEGGFAEPFDIIVEMEQSKTTIEAMSLLAHIADRTLRMTWWVGAEYEE